MRNRSVITATIGGLALALFYIGLHRVDATGGSLLLSVPRRFVATTRGDFETPMCGISPARSSGIAIRAGPLDGMANLLLMGHAGWLAETYADASLHRDDFLATDVLRERPSRSRVIRLLLVIPANFLPKSRSMHIEAKANTCRINAEDEIGDLLFAGVLGGSVLIALNVFRGCNGCVVPAVGLVVPHGLHMMALSKRIVASHLKTRWHYPRHYIGELYATRRILRVIAPPTSTDADRSGGITQDDCFNDEAPTLENRREQNL